MSGTKSTGKIVLTFYGQLIYTIIKQLTYTNFVFGPFLCVFKQDDIYKKKEVNIYIVIEKKSFRKI